MIETDAWPFIAAKWFTAVPEHRRVRVIVIHAMQFFERGDTAEVIAHDFATRGADNKGSAHINVDNNSIVQCVKDNNVAFAAPGCNNDGIQIELAGYTKQTREEWLDPYGRDLLRLAGSACAQYCMKYMLPTVHLSDEDLKAGNRGIVGHDQVTRVYKKSDHLDPGPGFPWDVFMANVSAAYEERAHRLGVHK